VLEFSKEILKLLGRCVGRGNTSNELKETRAGTIQTLILSAALAQKGGCPQVFYGLAQATFPSGVAPVL